MAAAGMLYPCQLIKPPCTWSLNDASSSDASTGVGCCLTTRMCDCICAARAKLLLMQLILQQEHRLTQSTCAQTTAKEAMLPELAEAPETRDCQ